MLYALTENGAVRMLTSEEAKERNYVGTQSRWDWKSYDEVCLIAELASDENTLYIGVDRGQSVSPRFDVIHAPKVGDDVSMSFNGDTTEDGNVVKISKSKRVITTSTGHRYYRRGSSGVWLLSKTWVLISGHHHERNPHL